MQTLARDPIELQAWEQYCRPCPICDARIGERCISGGRTYFEGHRERRTPRPIFTAHPQWIAWWKSMGVFENYSTRKAKRRPADLEVPTQAELLEGAA